MLFSLVTWLDISHRFEEVRIWRGGRLLVASQDVLDSEQRVGISARQLNLHVSETGPDRDGRRSPSLCRYSQNRMRNTGSDYSNSKLMKFDVQDYFTGTRC